MAAHQGLHFLLVIGVMAGAIGCGGEDAASTTGSDAQLASWASDGGVICTDQSSTFVTEVVSVDYGSGQNFGRTKMPEIVQGPPHGAGCCAGSLDVVSLGNGGEIVLAFADNAIIDGPGPDFVVFENPFYVGGDLQDIFAELATVSVSADGQSWATFTCEADELPADGCAGWHPVLQDGGSGPVDPTTSGGDAFDLADVGLSEARLVKIVDRPDLAGPRGVFDLDAVGIVHPLCP